jgi:MFS family permease
MPNHRFFWLPRSASQVKELFFSTALYNLASASITIFEPVYLYTLGFTLSKIMFFYFLVYLFYFFLLPLGGKVAKSKGFEHAIFYSSSFLILYFFILALAVFQPSIIWFAPIFLGIHKALYWPSYDADFALYGHKSTRGQEIGSFFSTGYLVNIIGPILGALLIENGGLILLFLFVALLVLFSNIPLLRTKEEFVPESFTYRESLQMFIEPKTRKYFLAFLGFGEELIVLTVWPIFIFLVAGSFVTLGAIASFSTFTLAILAYFFGKLIDQRGKKGFFLSGNFLYTIAWIGRLFVSGIPGVFFVDFASRMSKDLLSLPFFAKIYDHAKANHLVRTLIFFEMSLSLGKMLASGILAIVFYFSPSAFHVAWIIAAMFTLLYFRMRKELM